jgi:hypothetical protein
VKINAVIFFLAIFSRQTAGTRRAQIWMEPASQFGSGSKEVGGGTRLTEACGMGKK